MLLNKSEKILNRYLDIISYFKKMLEFEVLKYLILDENLLELMKFVSRPAISAINKPLEPYCEYFEFFKNKDYLNAEKMKNAFDSVLIENPQEQNSNNKSANIKIKRKMLSFINLQLSKIIDHR